MPNHHNFNTTTPAIETKIDNLLAKMTLAEKAGQMIQGDLRRSGKADIETRTRNAEIGSVLNLNDVAASNRLQKIAFEETRLGIPLIIGNDVIHGYRTIFPIPLAESCSWDPDLLEEAARIAAEEATAFGIHWTFAPMVDICREPRWGRIAEGAGEDPYLGEVLAAARVRGFQAQLSNDRKMVSCPKHYAAYGAAEAGKDYNTVDMSERRLRDVYLPPFKAAFDAGAGTVMSSFNELNGVPSTANKFLLQQVLREEWGFQGFVLSDYDAVFELIPHGLATDLKEAARLSVLAGMEMEMVSPAFHRHLAELVTDGAVPESVLDTAVRRIFRIKFLLNLFDDPYVDEAKAQTAILKPEYREQALEVATKSIVLLKNEEDLLPIDTNKFKRIALIGPLADDHHEILGAWHRIGRDEDTESVLDGFNQVLPENTDLKVIQGCGIDGEKPANIITAVTAANKSDLVVLVLGETEAMSGEAHSRATLGLPGKQQMLLEAVHATGIPIVVVLMTGRPLVVPWMAENIPAIVSAWHGGIRTGRAVADILFGHANPSGKLTASWPRAEGQIPVYYAHKNTGRPVGGSGTFQFNKYHRADFLDLSNEPQFPFGFGLSYTKFDYADLEVVTSTVAFDSTLVVTAKITNSGEVAGEEILQLYVRDTVGEVTRPVKELKGFQKILLQPGESQTVRFEIPVQRLGFHGLDLQYKVEPGEFKVWVGPNSAEGLEGSFQVTGDKVSGNQERVN
jgi:beta-glucosidase